jgi:hypothetical protein
MKITELRQIIREELSEAYNKKPNMDMVNRELNILDKFINNIEKNPTGDINKLIKIIKQSISNIRQYL